MSEKQRIVFISHSSYDKDYVSQLMELLRKQGLGNDGIFCSSYPGFGIPGGCDIYDFLRTRLVDYEAYVLFVISKENYYMSAACLNEMGAAWAMGSKSNAILLPGTKPSDLVGVVGQNYLSIVLDSEDAPYRLTELKDDIISFLSIESIMTSSWEYDRDTFLKECKKISKSKKTMFLPGTNIAGYLNDLAEKQVLVSQSLRRALIVASRLHDDAAKKWISSELIGYDSDDEVPEYRKVKSSNFRYSGFLGTIQVDEAMLPLDYLDEKTLEIVINTKVIDGIESIEKSAEMNQEIKRDLSTLIPVIFQRTKGYCQCIRIEQVLSSSQVERVISSVENRLIQFFIEKMA